MQIHRVDCLVIGTGLSGSIYALQAAREGLKVEILSIGDANDTNSDWAQGGIIYNQDLEKKSLIDDILNAGSNTSNLAAVENLVTEGAGAVKDWLIDSLAVNFDKSSDGSLDRTIEGGHQIRRIIHSKDFTGHEILNRATELISNEKSITRKANVIAIDLLTLSHSSSDYSDRFKPLTCFGAYVFNTATGEVSAITAKKTILATGGLGDLFLHTTNQKGSVGHGIAMAHRVGARLMDLEYIQFHPTVLGLKNAPNILLTEALRGEGAKIINSSGVEFINSIDPRGSLAPRDLVSRAIALELVRSGESHVFLDLSSINPSFIKERFPSIYSVCLEYGLDITKERVPIVPAAHFSCGGIYTDLNGRTSIQNLNAIGETACTGLHGANRLASTSLLECVVSAKFTALADANEIKHNKFHIPEPKNWKSSTKRADPLLLNQDLLQIKHTLWNYAGIVRSKKRLDRARRILFELEEEIQNFYQDCELTRDLITLRNAIQTAILVVHAASLNTQSIGCHYLIEEA